MTGFRMEKIQIVLVAILIPLGIFYWYLESDGSRLKDFFQPAVPVIHIGDVPVRVEVADSAMERTRGLSERDSLEGRDGMLFIFPEPGYHSIWMKDMRFPIDIIWIDEDLRVIGIDKNVTPDTYPRLFRPARPAKYVVETTVHFSDTYSLREGQEVKIPAKYLEDF